MITPSPRPEGRPGERPHSRRRWKRAPEVGGEEGTGLIASVVGLAVFLSLLLFATQILFDLYARSAVTAAAFDAARIVAGSDAGATPASEAAAENGARATLGAYGRDAAFTWDVTADQVALSVRVHDRSVLPAGLGRPLGLDQVDRTVVVRRERVR